MSATSIRRLVAAAWALAFAVPACAWTAAENAALNLTQGRCEAAVDDVNAGLKDGDPHAYYLVGLMHLRGLCVKARPERAAAYLEPAAKAGEAGAARLLVMMHGLGLGLAQSYAQAGRWAIAADDIRRAREPLAAASAPGTGPVAVDDAEKLGVLATVHAAVVHRMAYPRAGARIQAENVSLVVTLAIGPQGISYVVADRVAAIQAELAGSAIVRRSSVPHGEQVQEMLDELIRELPPLPAVDTPFVIPFEIRFRIN